MTKRKAKRPEPSTASLKRTVARCLDLLERINNDEPWTTRDVDTLLDECRNQICSACRDGRPHTQENAHDD